MINVTTTREDIKNWYKRGIQEGKKYMIIWCDIFDYEDYPEFYDSRKGAIASRDNPEAMQKYIESYNLSEDIDVQINRFRNHAF